MKSILSIGRTFLRVHRVRGIGTSHKPISLSEIGDKYRDFNNSNKTPNLEPVSRARELKTFLECSASNWRASTTTDKYKVLFAPQSQGSGKTFLGMYLWHFIAKDKAQEASLSVVEKVRQQITMPEHDAHYDALGQVNSFVIDMGMLNKRCDSLEEAVTAAIVARLYDVSDCEALDLVREEDLVFINICEILLQHQKAMVLVLDDVADVTSNEFNHFFKETAPDTSSVPEKTKAAMMLLQSMLDSVLGLPGMVVYLTGRSPEIAYQHITTLGVSPLLTRAVLMDAFEHRDIVELITRSCTRGGTPRPMKDALGLQTDQQVAELACFLEVTTAGVPQMVSNTLRYLVRQKILQRRAKYQGVFEYLASQSDMLFEKVLAETMYGFAPNWPSTAGGSRAEGWDVAMTKRALATILAMVREGKEVDTWDRLEVGPGVDVTTVDLLSVLGVPYTIQGHLITVRVGVWMVQTLLSEKEGPLLTTAEAKEVLGWISKTDKGVAEVALDAFVQQLRPKYIPTLW